MSELLLRTAGTEGMTAVSNIFIDYFMKEANGEFVKVYLYLLRCLGDQCMSVSVAGMADALDHTQRDISRALAYWERKGLLQLEYTADGELRGICLTEPEPPVVKREPAAKLTIQAPKPERAKIVIPKADNVIQMDSRIREHQYSADEICLLGKDSNVQEVLWFTERYIGHPLSPTESNYVLFWYDGMGMSADLIEYLVEYCADQNHKNIHYMNKVAMNWVQEGVATVDDAKSRDVSYGDLYHIVASGFGISGRSLTAGEREYLDRWSSFPGELVAEACKRTTLKIGRPSFQYADSILGSWKAQGALTMDEVKRLDENHKQGLRLRDPAEAFDTAVIGDLYAAIQ